MTKVTDAVTRLRTKYNNTFLLVHHFNKGNHDAGLTIDRMQGSARLQNWVEFQILMLKTNINDFHLWHVAKARGVAHDESVLGLKWEKYKFNAIGVIDDYRQFLITEEKRQKWLTVIEDCPESFTSEEWLNVFHSKCKELSERTGRTWLKEASSTPMVNKVKHGYYKKGLGLIDINNVDQ